jgi:hypothetical protein
VLRLISRPRDPLRDGPSCRPDWAFSDYWSIGLEYDYYYNFGHHAVTFLDANSGLSGPIDIKQRPSGWAGFHMFATPAAPIVTDTDSGPLPTPSASNATARKRIPVQWPRRGPQLLHADDAAERAADAGPQARSLHRPMVVSIAEFR